MLNRLDFWISIIVLGMLAWYELRLGRLFGPLARHVFSAFTSSPDSRTAVQQPAERSNDVQARSAHQDAQPASVQRSNVQDEPGGFEPPTMEELQMLARAIQHNARGQTKQAAIEEAFNVRKGGSAGWRRASQLFDAALGIHKEE